MPGSDEDDANASDEGDDDGLMGGVTFEDFYRDQRHAAVHAQPDALLQALVSIAHKGSASFDVTLIVNGFVVTGLVVSASEWLDEVAAQIEREAGGSAKVVSAAFRKVALALQVTFAEPSLDEQSELGPLCIHLRHASVLHSGVVTASDAQMRVRLSQVSAWALGTLRTRD